MLEAVTAKQVPASDINANHVRQMASLQTKSDAPDRAGLGQGQDRARPRAHEGRRADEEARHQPPARQPRRRPAGVHQDVAECHTIYGQAGNVGPDLTGVGRENLDAILTNLLDPSLVIGAPYYVYVAQTKDGDTISGLLVENSDKQVILRDQTKQTVIPKADLKKLSVQNISMMPEALEKTMTEQEFIDLVAFLLTPAAEGGRRRSNRSQWRQARQDAKRAKRPGSQKTLLPRPVLREKRAESATAREAGGGEGDFEDQVLG